MPRPTSVNAFYNSHFPSWSWWRWWWWSSSSWWQWWWSWRIFNWTCLIKNILKLKLTNITARFFVVHTFWPTAKYSPVHSIRPQSHCISLFRYVLKADTHQMRHSLSVFKWGEDFPERKDLETRVAVHPWSVYALFWEPVKNGTNFARGCNTRTTRASKHCTKCTLFTLNWTLGWCSYCKFYCTNYIAHSIAQMILHTKRTI